MASDLPALREQIVHGEGGFLCPVGDVEAFAAAAPYTFDCILMDAQMPVMDGYTAAQSIRKLPRADAASIRIYATTANTAPEDRTRAKEAGMNGFIAKPIDVKKLFEAIQAKKECEPS